MNRTVEEGLKRLEDRAAMLRFLADAAAGTTDHVPEPSVFSGLADTCGEIEALARQTRRSLSNDALSAELKPIPRNER